MSASNIPLEEEEVEEEVDYNHLCRELLVFAPQDSRLFTAISKSSQGFSHIGRRKLGGSIVALLTGPGFEPRTYSVQGELCQSLRGWPIGDGTAL